MYTYPIVHAPHSSAVYAKQVQLFEAAFARLKMGLPTTVSLATRLEAETYWDSGLRCSKRHVQEQGSENRTRAILVSSVPLLEHEAVDKEVSEDWCMALFCDETEQSDDDQSLLDVYLTSSDDAVVAVSSTGNKSRQMNSTQQRHIGQIVRSGIAYMQHHSQEDKSQVLFHAVARESAAAIRATFFSDVKDPYKCTEPVYTKRILYPLSTGSTAANVGEIDSQKYVFDDGGPQSPKEIERVMATNDIAGLKGPHRTARTPAKAVRSSSTHKLIAWVYRGFDGSVKTLYTEPEHRNQGLGKALVTHICAQFLDLEEENHRKSAIGCAHTDVAADNGGSVKTFKSLGALDAHDVVWIRLNVNQILGLAS